MLTEESGRTLQRAFGRMRGGKVESRVVLQPKYRAGLQGIEQFSHALIVTFLHKARFDPSKHIIRRPRGLDSMPEVGIFAQRTKDRPNKETVLDIIGRPLYDALRLETINGYSCIEGSFDPKRK